MNITKEYQDDVIESTTVTATHSAAVSYLVAVAYVLICLFILFGNTLTIVAIVTTPGMKTQGNLYILNLAVADSIVGVVVLEMSFGFAEFSRTAFDRYKYLCLSIYVLSTISCGQSLATLSLMAIDRLIYVERPFFHERVFTEKLTKGTMACSWVVSIIYGTFPLYYNVSSSDISCFSFRNLPLDTTRFVLTIPGFVAIVITNACYIRIAYVARKHRRRIAAVAMSVQTPEQTEAYIANGSSPQKSTMLFLTMNCIFTVCWMPFLINSLLLGLTKIAGKAVIPVTLLAHCNSGMNFVIYAFQNKPFARAYRKLLKRCCCPSVM